MDLEMEDNSALVLASSSGLGKASAKSLVKEGVNVTINGRDEEKLEEAAREIEEVGKGDVNAVAGDITDGKDIKKIVRYAVEEEGGLDHLVTSAGGPPSKPFLETSEQEWYESFDLLVMSVVRSVQEAIEYLREGEGTIVNITSMSVKEAIPELVLSNSVRMAVIGLMKTISKELAPEIRANAVLPGPHKTARIENLVEESLERGDVESYEEGLNEWSEGVPLNRIGEPIELGELVAFLSSPRSDFIDGTAISIDGGGSSSNL